MPRTLSFAPGDPATLHLSADARMAALVQQAGSISITLSDDLFESIIGSIVGQQLSGSAARAILAKLTHACGGISPKSLAAMDEDQLRQAGLSRPKARYIRGVAERVTSGEVDLSILPSLPDEEVIEHLTSLKGVGRWTAEMLLIFSLGRPDVFALDDLGLRRGVKLLYGLGEMPERKCLQQISDAWKPYRTAASLYLWEMSKRQLAVQ